MPGALRLTIETINAGNEDIEKVRGKDFGQMMEAAMPCRSLSSMLAQVMLKIP